MLKRFWIETNLYSWYINEYVANILLYSSGKYKILKISWY